MIFVSIAFVILSGVVAYTNNPKEPMNWFIGLVGGVLAMALGSK